tara:strand:+ start:870 stop:1121 length:252 start_codon:yes stop_codon:yes gene_type:complete
METEMIKEVVQSSLILMVIGSSVSMVLDNMKLVKGKHAKLVGLFITGVVAHLVNKEFGLNKCDKCKMAEVVTVPSVVDNELLN